MSASRIVLTEVFLVPLPRLAPAVLPRVHPGHQIALILTYMLCGIFNSGGFVLNFVLVAILMSADFWYVKVRRENYNECA